MSRRKHAVLWVIIALAVVGSRNAANFGVSVCIQPNYHWRHGRYGFTNPNRIQAMKVLVVGDSPGGLAAVRELGLSGWHVGVGSPGRYGLNGVSRWSRWTSDWHRVPHPIGDLEGFVASINDAVSTGQYEILLGTGDAEVLALSISRSKLAARVPYTTHENVLRGFDKLRHQAVARNAGLHTPHTLPANAGTLERFTLPVVVKARLHWTPGFRNITARVPTAISWSREEALKHAARMRAIGADPLFQEPISGSALHYVALCDEASKIVSSVGHVTTHLGASESGQSARAHTVQTDSDLEEKIQSFLTELRWFGLVDLQFWQPEDGEPVLADFNGRIYGGLALPHAAGMRPVDLWARLATGRPAAAPGPVRTGVRYQALEGDILRALSLTGTKRVTAVIDSIAHAFRSCHPVLCRTDPLPTVGYLAKLTSRLARSAKRGGGARHVP